MPENELSAVLIEKLAETDQILLYLHSFIAKIIDTKNNKKPFGINLVKVSNKKQGFVYYVRYYHEGKMIPSKWCTHTNDIDRAYEFAKKNRELLISGYHSRNGKEVEKFFNDFYDPDSHVYKNESRRTDINEKNERTMNQYCGKSSCPS